MWAYSRDGGWTEIEDFIEAATARDSEKKWEACGFNSYADFAYGERETFRITVMRRRQASHLPKPPPGAGEPQVVMDTKSTNPGYNFIVVIQFGGNLDKVALKTLPDLLKLLMEISPLAQNAKTTLKPHQSLHA
jgi:hypothetical protein